MTAVDCGDDGRGQLGHVRSFRIKMTHKKVIYLGQVGLRSSDNCCNGEGSRGKGRSDDGRAERRGGSV